MREGERLIRLMSTKKNFNSFLRFNGWIQNYGTFFSHSQEFYISIGRSIFSSDMSRVIIPSFAVNLKKEKKKRKEKGRSLI